MRIESELHRHRVRRTLCEVKRKLEEALRLSEERTTHVQHVVKR